MLQFTRKTFHRRGLGNPKTFCAGFFGTSLDLQKEIAAQGYTTSAAAFPPGAQFGSTYAPSWHALSGWHESVTFKTPPYRVSQRSILPTGSPPFIKVADGKSLVEIPQTCKIDWMVSADDMKAIFKQHLAIAREGKPTAVCLAIHEVSAAEHFSKYDEVLSYIDKRTGTHGKHRVQYRTASELRTKLLAQWRQADSDHRP